MNHYEVLLQNFTYAFCPYFQAHPEYHYEYHVGDHHTKDYKSKHEVREGHKVKGTYSLLEPDHKTIRIVDYVADKKQGFIAKVSHKKHE
nr:unnamed protein product [Callosobruchus chinensis]